MTETVGLREQLDGLFAFLRGERAYEGVWFGDDPDEHPEVTDGKPFWWRTALVEPIRESLALLPTEGEPVGLGVMIHGYDESKTPSIGRERDQWKVDDFFYPFQRERAEEAVEAYRDECKAHVVELYTTPQESAEVERLRANERAMQDDIGAALRALGLPDHARDASPHQVMVNEVVPAIERLRAEADRLQKALVTALVALRTPDPGEIEAWTYPCQDFGDRDKVPSTMEVTVGHYHDGMVPVWVRIRPRVTAATLNTETDG